MIMKHIYHKCKKENNLSNTTNSLSLSLSLSLSHMITLNFHRGIPSLFSLPPPFPFLPGLPYPFFFFLSLCINYSLFPSFPCYLPFIIPSLLKKKILPYHFLLPFSVIPLSFFFFSIHLVIVSFPLYFVSSFLFPLTHCFVCYLLSFH